MIKFLKKNYIAVFIIIISLILIADAIIANYQIYLDDTKTCKEIIKLGIRDTCVVTKGSAYSIYMLILIYSKFYIIYFIAPFIITILSIKNFHTKIYTGFIQSELSRIKYRKYIIKNILEAWKNSLLLPIILLILFVISFIYTGNFNVDDATRNTFSPEYLNNMPLCILVNFMYVIIYCMTVANLGMIFCKSKKKFYIIVIFFFITFFSLEFLLLLLGFIFQFFEINITFFNLADLFNFERMYSIKILWALMYFMFSLFLLYIFYRNKEKLFYENKE